MESLAKNAFLVFALFVGNFSNKHHYNLLKIVRKFFWYFCPKWLFRKLFVLKVDLCIKVALIKITTVDLSHVSENGHHLNGVIKDLNHSKEPTLKFTRPILEIFWFKTLNSVLFLTLNQLWRSKTRLEIQLEELLDFFAQNFLKSYESILCVQRFQPTITHFFFIIDLNWMNLVNEGAKWLIWGL